MLFSCVTISYNQARYLKSTIESVLGQTGVDLEYILVDPGSSDGSRDIINSFQPSISQTIFEKDCGPADGLNKGFSRATGDIFCYLNSDDLLSPGALRAVQTVFEANPDVDVLCGHANLIDGEGAYLRRIWSDHFNPKLVAFGTSVQIQPSTFFRRSAFARTSGFNTMNKCAWDGELLIDLWESGASFKTINRFLSSFRLHGLSITNSGSHDGIIRAWNEERFTRLMGRRPTPRDRFAKGYHRLVKHALAPRRTIERLQRGRIYRRGEK